MNRRNALLLKILIFSPPSIPSLSSSTLHPTFPNLSLTHPFSPATSPSLVYRHPLEETWKAKFSSLRYAKIFSGPVCFCHAILSPLGYETALFKGLTEDIDCKEASAHELWQNSDNLKHVYQSLEKGARVSFGLPLRKHILSNPLSAHNVFVVCREDYLAHPRRGGKVESRLSNEPEVFQSLKSWASNYEGCKINLVKGLFAHMSLMEQVQAIQDALIIIGAHSAGLTHIVSALPNTVILEIISGQVRRPHFQLITQWKGLVYHAINLNGSCKSWSCYQ